MKFEILQRWEEQWTMATEMSMWCVESGSHYQHTTCTPAGNFLFVNSIAACLGEGGGGVCWRIGIDSKGELDGNSESKATFILGRMTGQYRVWDWNKSVTILCTVFRVSHLRRAICYPVPRIPWLWVQHPQWTVRTKTCQLQQFWALGLKNSVGFGLPWSRGGAAGTEMQVYI